MRSSLMLFTQRLVFGVGLVVLGYAVGTVAYAELYQRYQSWKFKHQIGTLELTKTAVDGLAPMQVRGEAQAPQRAASRLDAIIKNAGVGSVDLSEGDAIGKLEIPQIGMSVMVFQGVNEATLRIGAGHVPGTPLPGTDGNSAIAGHRDTFFRKLKRIRAGDRIQFLTVRGTAQYIVDSTEIVEPADTRLMESRGHSELTLISCYPFYFVGSAPRRFIVHAHAVSLE
jgi:LPXTG-site transpeptidase (sortase) family protein